MKMMRDIAAHHFVISVSCIFGKQTATFKKVLLSVADNSFILADRNIITSSFDKMIPGFFNVKILHIPSINFKKFSVGMLFSTKRLIKRLLEMTLNERC